MRSLSVSISDMLALRAFVWRVCGVNFAHRFSQEAVTMKDGRVLDAGTGINLLPRYASLSDDNFTRAGDFVPERLLPPPPPRVFLLRIFSNLNMHLVAVLLVVLSCIRRREGLSLMILVQISLAMSHIQLQTCSQISVMIAHSRGYLSESVASK